MVNCKSFQVIFKEEDGHTYSATFDAVIPLNCRGKFVDVKGKIYDLVDWYRTIHEESTLNNVIHNATKPKPGTHGAPCGIPKKSDAGCNPGLRCGCENFGFNKCSIDSWPDGCWIGKHPCTCHEDG